MLMEVTSTYMQLLDTKHVLLYGGSRGRMVVRFTTTCTISDYHHY
jgi:hypothetical protein